MADDVTLPGTGSVVETVQQPDGSHRQVIALGSAETAALIAALKQIAHPVWLDQTVGAIRVLMQTNVANGSVQIASGTLSNVTQIAGVPANSLVNDAMQTAWATSIRPRVT